MTQADSARIPQLDASTAQRLVSVAARLTRLHTMMLGRLDTPLTFRQYRSLTRVQAGCSSLTELASFGNLTIPTVSEGVDVLVRRGLLTRVPNPDDRRAISLEITSAGAEAVAAADAALENVANDLIGSVSAEGRALLPETLAAIFEAATAYFQDENIE
jgi:DNA-binding MarR family transcriptional regulator